MSDVRDCEGPPTFEDAHVRFSRSEHVIANFLCCPAHLAMVLLMRDCDVLVSGPFDQCAEACYYQISV